jgi:hypothetical protein
MALGRGLEPLKQDSKSCVLPLNDPRKMVRVTGFEPAASCIPSTYSYQAELHPDVRRSHWSRLLPCVDCPCTSNSAVVEYEGFEPSTSSLPRKRSSN